MKLKSLVLAGVAACTLAALAPAANAARIQLGFILDRSGSISEADWDIITAGLGNAIKLIPVGGTDTYEVSVVTFSTNAAAQFSNVVLTTEAERTALANGVAALETLGTSGVTNYTEAFTVMDTVLRNTSALADKTYVNFATDGDPNPNSANAADKRNEMINTAVDGYVDNISIERIGANVGTVLLRDRLCFPAPATRRRPSTTSRTRAS